MTHSTLCSIRPPATTPRWAAACVLGCLVAAASQAAVTRLEPARVFDGESVYEGWIVLVEDGAILYAGDPAAAPDVHADEVRALPGQTLLPGLIEGHSHVLLHPYDETSWNDQVLVESRAERVARAVNHLRASLEAGITTMRDLGSEGAGYDDVGLRDAVAKGVVPGPRLLVAGRAIVATGSYGPKGFREGVEVPLGAETADGHDDLVRVVRDQIGHGIDLVKVYADYRWGLGGEARPTFSQQELATIVETARSSGRPTVAHAATAEGMRRAVLAGVETIEHGDGATREVYELMVQRGVALCPTIAAGDAISRYRGWNKGVDPEPERIVAKRRSLAAALQAGVTICFGGDVGVYSHGDNVRELELMVDYGMSDLDALRAATSVNARIFHLEDEVGSIRAGLAADLLSVDGDPTQYIADLRKVRLVMKAGVVVVGAP